MFRQARFSAKGQSWLRHPKGRCGDIQNSIVIEQDKICQDWIASGGLFEFDLQHYH
jgi:hypothetical protein